MISNQVTYPFRYWYGSEIPKDLADKYINLRERCIDSAMAWYRLSCDPIA